MKLSKEEISLIKPHNGWCIVKLKMFNDTVKFLDGELKLDTVFHPEDHISVDGIIHAIPDRLYFNRNDQWHSDPWLTDIEVRPGDQVFMDYFAVLMALGRKANRAAEHPDEKYFEDGDGGLYVFIKYTDLYFVYEKNTEESTIRLLNGYVLISPIIKEVKTQSIILPKHLKKRNAGDWGLVEFVGGMNRDYSDNTDKRTWKTDNIDVQPGDVILYRKMSRQKVENSLHKKIDVLQKDYYLIQRHRIRLVLRGEPALKILS